MDKIILNDGNKMPIIGLGTWQVSDVQVQQNIKWALDAGYRHFDTAAFYGNEGGVGDAVRNSGISREEIFITTKLNNPDQGYENALKAIDVSLNNLQIDYVDLYLIHWPFGDVEKTINKRVETWKAMEEILKSGKAKSIGVSNFTEEHLQEIFDNCEIKPAVNQVEYHVFLNQENLLDFCTDNNVIVTAYSPLSSGKNINDPRVGYLAEKYEKSNAQIMIRWIIQKGMIVIPKSSAKERIEENINIFDFEISEEDMKFLNSLNEDLRVCWNPYN